MIRIKKGKNERMSHSKDRPFNAEERICRFKQSVEEFYNRMEKDWLSTPTIREHHIVINERDYQISENGVDNYEVEVKEIIIDNRQMFLKPLGTMFGAIFGRIDLICEARSEMFVLIGKDIFSPRQLLDSINMDEPSISPFPSLRELEWKYVSKYPDLKYETVDSHVFLNVIMKVIHG